MRLLVNDRRVAERRYNAPAPASPPCPTRCTRCRERNPLSREARIGDEVAPPINDIECRLIDVTVAVDGPH